LSRCRDDYSLPGVRVSSRWLLAFVVAHCLLHLWWRWITRDLVQRLLQVPDRLTDGGSNSGELSWAKNDEDDGEDDHEMHWL